MKKVVSVLLILCFAVLGFQSEVRIEAEDFPAYCDVQREEYDYDRCLSFLREANLNIQDIEASIEDAQNSLAEAQQLATSYASQAESLTDEITKINAEITELEGKIETLEKEITENQVKVDALNERVLTRMEDAQKSMHFDPYVKFILSSNGFDDMLRRVYGLEAIGEKDKEDREELKGLIAKLEKDKAELDEAKVTLDASRQELLNKQAQYIIMRNYWLQIQRQTEIEIENLQNSLEDAKRTYSEILDSLDDISGLPSSAGLIAAVPGASISAGVWHYPASFGGGVHLGIDYAVKRGTNIVAPANGVVIVSSDTCPSTGYLGNGCPYDGSAAAAGGNQVHMIVSATDSSGQPQVYGLLFCHMQSGSPHATGYVSQGEVIGQVGSSGNSTGPHCHVELFYLGPGDMGDIQRDYLNRSYSYSFNCGWGSVALGRLCENGVGAPCRLNPANYLGR